MPNITASKQRDTFYVEIKREEVEEAIRVLAQKELVRRAGTYIPVSVVSDGYGGYKVLFLEGEKVA